MIHYQLRCSADHGFDGWFRNSSAFEAQAKAGLVACPECGITAVNRALMAPSVSRRGGVVDQEGQAATPEPSVVVQNSAGAMPAKLMGMLQKIRAEVEKNCEHVGTRFADEARAIHRGETPPRSIYGESTPEQAEALAEDGIEVARIPWVPRADG